VEPDGPIQTAADYTNWSAHDGTPYYEYIRQNKASWTEHWDDNAKVPYLTKGNYFLSYDNEQSIGLKAQYVVDKGLGGVIVWTVYEDLEIGGTATDFGPKLKRYSSVKSPLVNKINQVFAQGSAGLPTVSITAPANNANVAPNSSLVINATASDPDGSIAKVEFLLDGTKVGEDTSSPYSYTISSIAAGPHTIQAKAIDNSNNTATASVNITASANAVPSVSIQSPANGASLAAGNITITAAASDSDGSIAKVEFYQGTTKLGEDTSTPYSFNWTNVAAGSYALTARATDNLNAVATSATVNITVTGSSCTTPAWVFETQYTGGALVSRGGNIYRAKWWTEKEDPLLNPTGVWELVGPCGSGGGNVNPTGSITAPANNTGYTAPASVTITASANDSDGTVSKVEFFQGTTKLGKDTSAPYSYTWTGVTAGSYSLTIKVTDNAGGTATSAAVAITVTGGGTGNCATVPQYVQNGGYVAGSQVKNAGSLYKCKDFPYSGWCNGQAWAYAPGTGTNWQDAWTLEGICQSASARMSQSENTALLASSFHVVGYMPSWQGSATDIQYSNVTHINYAFIRPTTTGELTSLDNPQKLRDIVSLAHANGVKVGIAVGGWSELNNADFQSMAGNASYRTTFVNNIMSFIQTYQLDGVDIDWEYPVEGADPANFSTLMTALGNSLHAQGKFLTAAVSAQGYFANGVQSSVFNAVDFLNIMVYDGDGGAGHSPYSYAISSLDYWAGRGLPAAKTVLGVPFYARPSWKSFKTLVAEGANPNNDTYNGDYFNGINTIKQKTNLAFDRSLGGMMIWELSQDATGNNSLLTAIRQVVDLRTGTTTPQSPYGGTVRNIPGTVEAEHYDLGGEGVAYHDLSSGNSGNTLRTDNVDIETTTDTGGGQNVGWIQAGEWLEYTVQITTAGTYTLQARVASTAAGKTFHIELDGANISGTLTVPNTGGWQTWQTVTATTPSLTTGQKILRIVMDAGDFNLNKVTFTTGGTTNPPPAVSLTAPANGATYTAPASVTLQASASDNGSVAKVEFFQGSTKLGEDTSSPYSYNWTGVVAGSYALTAKATDNQGASATSAVVNITVTGGSAGCSGVAQYVENGGYVAGSIVQNQGSQYECKPYPFSGWCNGAAWAYAPGTGAYWGDAWVLKGTCSSGARMASGNSASFETEAEGLSFYPNPGESGKSRTVTLVFDKAPGEVRIQLRTLNGTEAFTQHLGNIKSTSVQVELPALSQGLYLMRVQGEKSSWLKKYLVK
jgi:GH18 family chitinase/chitodextrinase